MKRLYEAAAYGPQETYWASTCPPQDWPVLPGPVTTDVAIIGGGFTGLNAALALAQSGTQVTVLDAEHPGWGASGRNGGFCCTGGALLTDATIAKRFGTEQATKWETAQRTAIDHVAHLLERHSIHADTHSQGEICLAHSPRAARKMQGADFISADALREMGIGGTWHGGQHTKAGFALNPAKYHDGLTRAARASGALIYAQTPVTGLSRHSDHWHLTTPHGTVTADKVLIATNGYSSEDVPPWLRARTLPVQSSVIVTRQLSDAEQQAQGWTSELMAYDSRALLHYFRMLPEGRFLFGMRGGLTAKPREQATVSNRIRADFHNLFPSWQDIEITHEWSGLVCLTAQLTPFMGAVPDAPGLFATMGFHGNGVAMGSYLGKRSADLIHAADTADLPGFLSQPPKRFPFGAYRRNLLRPSYWLAETFDL